MASMPEAGTGTAVGRLQAATARQGGESARREIRFMGYLFVAGVFVIVGVGLVVR